MRSLVVVLSAGAALAFIAASGLMNWVFMTSLGRSEFEQHIFGAVSVAVSAFIALLPTLMLWAWRERRFAQIAVGVPVFLAFVAFSLSSAVGFAAKNRGAQTEDRGLATSRLSEVRQEIGEAETRRKALGSPRAAPVVQETLRGMEQDSKWRQSKECQNAILASERTFCKNYFDLKAEGARAGELAALDIRIDRLRAEARGYEEKGAGREADSQAVVLANLLGTQAMTVERGMTLFLALLVEIGAAAGLYLATGHMRHEPRPVRAVVLEALPEIRLERAREVTSETPRRIEGPARQLRRVPKLKRIK